jgi:hypothetical protein
MAELESDGHTGPYDLVVTSAMKEDLRRLLANSTTSALTVITQPGWVRSVFVSDNLYTSAGAQTSAILCEPGPMNFVGGFAPETLVPQVDVLQLSHHAYDYDVWEVCAPHIKRPTSICEITGISA